MRALIATALALALTTSGLAAADGTLTIEIGEISACEQGTLCALKHWP